MQSSSQETFAVELLTELRNDHFSLRAWYRFFQRSWMQTMQTVHSNPSLHNSWRQFTLTIALLALLALIGNGLLLGISDTLYLLPGFAFCVVWQQCDLYWHLGLNRSVHSGALLPRVGLANELTWIRGLCASYLLGRLFAGLPTPSTVALAIFLCGIVTDILDGLIARNTGTQSRLGQLADAETDFCLYLSLTIILLRNGVLPLPFGLVMLFRFIVPFVAVLLSYLAFARPVRFSSTVWGKYAGLAQCLSFLVLLAPAPFASLAHLLSLPILSITTCLLIIAPIAQITHIDFLHGKG
ncbi:CDP-alcohol phosphatidyltransferase family protein [Ktedonosporobacter rubrisoli]|uniref:CDP-alcohol phosphatidyltransferase family protein n=1 Tax=Ktedonosporobacter rubrisoli TaxID=2509675 RepID=A0A4P6JN95_KTERU|nr:CDP-alcohol phosphatidyltransferase family protein [Ktedonosporobacter rubrisoli]QBD76196.1 CDP-alcohol phosphatidyltransferase family protein [Ktedonosporobacter rubrisoli]